jgi:hypothetical protein
MQGEAAAPGFRFAHPGYDRRGSSAVATPGVSNLSRASARLEHERANLGLPGFGQF